MTPLALAFLGCCTAALLLLPRRWAALPLLAGALYMTLGQGVEIGPFNFSLLRLLIAIAAIRVLLRGELGAFTPVALDKWLLVWASWAVASSLFHEDPSAALVNRLGMVYDACGTYLVLRCLCGSREDVERLFRMIAFLLAPVAVAMVWENQAGRNPFAALGGVPLFPEVRQGIVRSQGPFAHSILAGSVGAACLPLMLAIWRHSRSLALVGTLGCLAMITASGSSGPLLSASAAIGALALWPMRHRMRVVVWAAVLGYIALDVAMNAPAYYLLARLDLSMGSTSWHRAALIEAAIIRLPEWWATGTDYTGHWLPYGVPWSSSHADITNYYIWMGVLGGLPLMLLFVAMLAKGFGLVGVMLAKSDLGSSDAKAHESFIAWAIGASLFAHAATFVSVTYFDQSVVFLYLTLAAAGSYAAHQRHLRIERTTRLPPLNGKPRSTELFHSDLKRCESSYIHIP